MPTQNGKTTRDYHCTDAAMLIGISVITDNAQAHIDELSEEDTTITKDYLTDLRKRIDTAVTDILGADNLQGLRDATSTVNTATDTALDTLRSIKNFIERKYSEAPARRAELLTNLGFAALYHAASHRQQEAIGELLVRASGALTSALVTELKGKGLSQARIDSLTTTAAVYNPQNITQEATKSSSKVLNNTDVQAMNALYRETMIVAKTGQHCFHSNRALKDGFVFEKVVPHNTRGSVGGAPSSPAII